MGEASPVKHQVCPSSSARERRLVAVDEAAGDPGGGDGHRAEAGGLVLGRAGGVERGRRRGAPGRRACRRAPNPGRRRRRPAPPSAVSACSGCQAGRSSAERWTAAAIASHGSSGETGASEPRASATPSSTIQRSGKQRSARSGQISSVTSRSSSRCAGCTLATTPRRPIVGRRRRGSSAARARSNRARPSPRTPPRRRGRPRHRSRAPRSRSPCSVARVIRARSSAGDWLGRRSPTRRRTGARTRPSGC